MRTYIRFLGSAALTLIALGSTLLVQGGWQAAAAAFAIFQGLVFASSFIALGAAAERPRSRRPGWAVGGTPRSATAEAERARADVADGRVGRARRTPAPQPDAIGEFAT